MWNNTKTSKPWYNNKNYNICFNMKSRSCLIWKSTHCQNRLYRFLEPEMLCKFSLWKKDRNSLCVWHKQLDTAQEKERFYGIKLMTYVLIWFWNFIALLISQHLENKKKLVLIKFWTCFSQNRKYKQILNSK